jgi:hypothetical protein
MDPNEALHQLQLLSAQHDRAVTKAEAAARGDSNDVEIEALYEVQAVGERLVEQFRALDEWMSRGGFRPQEWLS